MYITDQQCLGAQVNILSYAHTRTAPPSSSSSPKRVEKPAVEKELSPPPAKKETHKATKLLDELFRKTKTTPSIYWLPLTDAQVTIVIMRVQQFC